MEFLTHELIFGGYDILKFLDMWGILGYSCFVMFDGEGHYLTLVKLLKVERVR